MEVLILTILLLKLTVLLVNLVFFPRLQSPKSAISPHGPKPKVSILIPARNEADNLLRTLPSWLWQDAEIILLDDASEDDTAHIAQTIADQHPRPASWAPFRIIRGAPLPKHWLGKNWACWQLAQAARGDILLFTDADVLWQADTLKALLARFQQSDADLLTVWPQQQVRSLGERLIVPLVDDVLLCLFPVMLCHLKHPLASAANGQLMMFKRDAYFGIGGHRTVRQAVLEDVQLGQVVKRAGGRLSVALGGSLLQVRMYHNYRDVIEGFGKNILSFHGNRLGLICSALLHLLVYTLPLLLGWWDLVALALLERLLVNLKTGRYQPLDVLEVLLTPLAPIAALPIYSRAWWRRYLWKGRSYLQQPVTDISGVHGIH